MIDPSVLVCSQRRYRFAAAWAFLAPHANVGWGLIWLRFRFRRHPPNSAHDQIPRSVHQVIVLLDDPALVIPTIETKLLKPLLTGRENLQAPGAEQFPHLFNAGLNGFIRQADTQSGLTV